MVPFTTNNIVGSAVNPYDKTKTTGGSSEGSAGLVSTFSCSMAVATDLGGSIRYPAG